MEIKKAIEEAHFVSYPLTGGDGAYIFPKEKLFSLLKMVARVAPTG